MKAPRRLERPGEWAVWMLALGILADLVALYFEIEQHSLLGDLIAGRDVSFAQADASDTRAGAAYIAQAAIWLATVIAFLVWFRRAYRNLPRLGVEKLRFKPGWAVGGWFVPILAWFRPKQTANDIWRGSDPVDGNRAVLEQLDPPRLLNVWWALWVLSTIAGNVDGRAALNADSLDEQRTASVAAMAADVAYVAAAVAAILVVRAITRRQDGLIADGASSQPAASSPG